MALIKKVITKIFNKRYRINEVHGTDYVSACNGRIIRGIDSDESKKSYCATYVLAGFKD